MPQIDIFSSPIQLHTTTLSELHKYALENVKPAYESLPHHLLLRFERVDQKTFALFTESGVVSNSRLLLGLSKHSHKGEFIPAYAYIVRRNGLVHQVLLRFGYMNLKATDFESVEWEKPFDSIYDAYGQTERAGDRMCTMAAYYFLATNRLSEITTRSSSFIQHFTKLCDKIHAQNTDEVGSPEVPTAELIVGLHEDQPLLSVRASAQDRASNQCLLEPQQQDMHRKQEPHDEAFAAEQDAQLIPVTYQIDSKGDRSRSTILPTNLNSSRISSPTVWDESNDPPVGSLHRSNIDLLVDLTPAKGKPLGKLQDREEAAQPVITEKKALNSDDLAAFVDKFRKLETENAQLHEHKVANADLEVIVSQSKNDAKQAYTRLQELQERLLNQETETKELRKELARTKIYAAMNHKLTRDLGKEQQKFQQAQCARQQAQTMLATVQTENERLEQNLAKAEQNGSSRQKLALMEASLHALETDKKEMQHRIRSLKGEVQVEKTKFNDYKRKIRNLSLDP